MEKGEIAQNEQFHPFPQLFSMQSVSYSLLTATFQFSSAASLNLEQFQNGVIGKGLKEMTKSNCICKQAPLFLHVCSTSILKRNSLFSTVFSILMPYGEPFAIFINFIIVFGKLFQFDSLIFFLFEKG